MTNHELSSTTITERDVADATIFAGFALDRVPIKSGYTTFELTSGQIGGDSARRNTIVFNGPNATASVYLDLASAKPTIVDLVPCDKKDPQSARVVTVTEPDDQPMSFNPDTDVFSDSSPAGLATMHAALESVAALADGYAVQGLPAIEVQALTATEVAEAELSLHGLKKIIW